MKTRPLLTLILSISTSLILGCASTPKDAARAKYPTPESILTENDVKNNPPTVYDRPIEEVRPAAARALAFVGCKLEVQEPFFITGHRPNKFGLFVGSGGENVKVFLYPESTNQTKVWVDTDKTFVGIVGQKDWNQQVLEEMTRELTQR